MQKKKPSKTKTNKKPSPPYTHTKEQENNIEFVLCWPTASGHGACFGVWLISPVTLHCKTWIFPSSAGIINYK